MTWTYTVKENQFQNGHYEATIKNVLRKEWNGVSKIVIEWRIFAPEECLGNTLPQTFNVEHANPETRRIATGSFDRIAKQIKEIPIDKQLTEQELFKLMVDKRATFEVSADGEYTNIKKVKIIDDEPSPVYGMNLPQKPDPESAKAILNDDIPF